MKSHHYEYERSDVARNVLGSLLPVGLFVLVLQAGVLGSWWPAPRPTLDTERTVLLHQADAARGTNHIDVLLLGDSSCLMNVSARRLERALGRTTLNLATFSFLDVQAQALLLREFTQHRPTPPLAVVLLMHPEALRRIGSDPYYVAALTNYWAGRDHHNRESFDGRMSGWLGIDAFSARFLSRIATPLPGAYGRRFGFSADLERFMDEEKGSAIDPDQAPLSGSPEFRLATSLEKASREFRAAVPAGTKLIAGMTPVPARLAGTRFATQQAALLQGWGAMLHADLLLTNLPATLPDRVFARTTHLREEAIPSYTDQLADGIKSALP